MNTYLGSLVFISLRRLDLQLFAKSQLRHAISNGVSSGPIQNKVRITLPCRTIISAPVESAS